MNTIRLSKQVEKLMTADEKELFEKQNAVFAERFAIQERAKANAKISLADAQIQKLVAKQNKLREKL